MEDARPTDGATAVVLLSGGLDSATVLGEALARGYRCHVLTFIYGQRHTREVDAAVAVAEAMAADSHRVVEFPVDALVESSLTDPGAPLRDAGSDGSGVPADIPDTYVPSRNIIFLSAALALAESIGADAVFIGANAVDYSGYPDCRPGFIAAFQAMADAGTKRGVEGRGIRIEAPLLHMSKTDIIKLASELGVPLGLTWSCYSGGSAPCGTCDSCRLRAEGFKGAGIDDPAASGDAEQGRQGDGGAGGPGGSGEVGED